MSGTWYAAVTFGSRATLPRGPWRTREDTAAALQRWEARTGGGTWSPTFTGGSSLRVNTYRTRAQARAATVEDRPGHECVTSEPVSDYLVGSASW